MKPRTAQLGARKNPDSPRVHGLRLTVNSSSRSDPQTRDSQAGGSFPPVPSTSEELNLSPEDAANGTTEGETRREGQLLTVQEVANLLRVPVSWVYGHTRKRSRERIPGYRVGKYWRFSAVEVMSWLREARRQLASDRMP
ncbi:MAG: helix-turn-helix domain-containing protein [Candidatus Acidiferrales bacterium]